jgi:hypothetical protein
MSTLQQLIDANPDVELELDKSGTKYIFNRIKNGNVIMDDGSSHALSDTGWELYIEAETLADLKARRIIEIDNVTQELIKGGFTFDSKQFSLSEKAQINWVGIKAAIDILTFPLDVTTLNDEEYELVDTTSAVNFCGTGLATKQSYLDSGRALKLQINSATTNAEVDAVVDNRLP